MTIPGRPLDQRLLDLLVSGVTYLAKSASRKGHWGETRSTALAGMCLQLRETGGSLWLDAIREWLFSQQIVEGDAAGSWGEEVWDTAMCLISLKDLEVSSRDPRLEAGLDWITGLYSLSGRNNWHDEPWETSWALIALLKSGRFPRSIDLSKAMHWLVSLQGPDGRIVAPHYTAYFLIVEQLAAKVGLPEADRATFAAAADKCADFLHRELTRSPTKQLWAGEAWMNGQILWSLGQTGRISSLGAEEVEQIVTWFEGAQGPHGGWSDVEDTASAILGLHGLWWELANLQYQGVKRKGDIDGLLEGRLRKAVPMPRLQIRRHFLERDSETGYVSLHVREEVVKAGIAVFAFLFVGLVGWIADLKALWEGLAK